MNQRPRSRLPGRVLTSLVTYAGIALGVLALIWIVWIIGLMIGIWHVE